MNRPLTIIIRKHWDVVLVGCALFFIVLWSLPILTTKPAVWTDEAVNVNIARSFSNHGVLSPQTSPDTFFKSPHLIQGTGYPTTVPLAGFFKLFGYGFTEARAYMLIWVLIALVAIFSLARKLFLKHDAVYAFFLIGSFASFYANGRTVTGEIPGFVFLLAGFYFLLVRKRYFLTGILWGLAVVAKPSVFGLIIPSIFFTLLLERLPFKQFLRQLSAIAGGMLPAAFLWFFFVLQNPFGANVWQEVGAFYKNPFGSDGDTVQNIAHNLSGFFQETTLIYFGALFMLVICARLLLEKKSALRIFYTFTIVYAVFAFLYYLKSPGYLRYILVAELLVLFIVPHAVRIFLPWTIERVRTLLPARVRHFKIQNISTNIAHAFVVLALIALQGVQMFTVSNISSSNTASHIAAYINENFPESSVGLLNAPSLGLFIDPMRTFLVIELLGLETMGKNPLFLEMPPDVILGIPSSRFLVEGEEVLEKQYMLSLTVNGYAVYKKIAGNSEKGE